MSLLFADDTTLLLSGEDLAELTLMADREFQKNYDFFRSNRLALHPSKTNYIIFSNREIKDTPPIFCNNNNDTDEINPSLISPIECITVNSDVPAVKFLGVFIDPGLNFKYHISKLKIKLSKGLFAINQAKNFLPTKSLQLLYYALFHSHLLYALPCWSSCADGLINEVFRIQKKAVRIISGSTYNAHTEPLFKKLGILPLHDLVTFSKLQMMQRFFQNYLPISFNDTWTRNEIRQIGENAILLRNNPTIILNLSRLSLTDKMPLFKLPKIWEDFPDEEIKFIRSKTEFDARLKTFFLNDLDENYRCERLFCPACSHAG
jgi:hypothetical protein